MMSAALGGACGGLIDTRDADPAPPSAPTDNATIPDDAAAPTAPDAAPITVTVGHVRELRGVWISTVNNGTWPSKTALGASAAKAELLTIFDALALAHMNTVFFQVRPESDALYASALEPWSRFLSGVQGTDPGWDPLAFAVAEGHARGLEVHAWVNPYRGLANAAVTAAANHVTRTLSKFAYVYGTPAVVWMDPGAPEVRAHIIAVLRDIVKRYDVDGIHFDDYFYPYPNGTPFPDASSYALYTDAGGVLSLGDWRRDNVNTLVREASVMIAAERPDVRFGVSPFGIYRPGTPPGITGLDAYDAIYCDPVKWMAEGWVDYLVPQLYWPSTKQGQEFGKLVTWWAGLAKGGRSVFAGHDLSLLGTSPAWPLDEFRTEMKLSRAERPRGLRGNVFFTARPLVDDKLGVRTAFLGEFWSSPSLTPPLATAQNAAFAPPRVTRGQGGDLGFAHDAEVRAYAVYRESKGGYALSSLLPGPTAVMAHASGRWAVSAIDRRGTESRGVVVDLP